MDYFSDLFQTPDKWPGHHGDRPGMVYYSGMSVPGMDATDDESTLYGKCASCGETIPTKLKRCAPCQKISRAEYARNYDKMRKQRKKEAKENGK